MRGGVSSVCRGILLAAATAAAAGCFGGRLQPRDAHFYSLPLRARIDSLRAYPLHEQVEIYLVGITRRHPPALYLADALASNGPPLIPHVLPYLRRRMHPGEHAQLLYVFERMACGTNGGGYPLAGEADLLSAARAAMRATNDEYWRARMQRSLNAMEGQCNGRAVRAPEGTRDG